MFICSFVALTIIENPLTYCLVFVVFGKEAGPKGGGSVRAGCVGVPMGGVFVFMAQTWKLSLVFSVFTLIIIYFSWRIGV